ncbi:hypothetical protein Zmor_028198 [Zophobas morio]|uniref:Uncharacterized protein n=1 Tax=Zophobas morio TaxID=2755281 RepID=A0AA38HQK3_9CUCU|nr:hypothetical protein Zmor_028198 [Zophobas morio]
MRLAALDSEKAPPTFPALSRNYLHLFVGASCSAIGSDSYIAPAFHLIVAFCLQKYKDISRIPSNTQAGVVPVKNARCFPPLQLPFISPFPLSTLFIIHYAHGPVIAYLSDMHERILDILPSLNILFSARGIRR